MNSMRFPKGLFFWIVFIAAIIFVWVETEVWWMGLIGGVIIMFVLWLIFVLLAKLFG